MSCGVLGGASDTNGYAYGGGGGATQTNVSINIRIRPNTIDTLNVVLIANGGNGGSNWYIADPFWFITNPLVPANIPLAAGGGGGGGAVLVSSYNTSTGGSFIVTLGAIGSNDLTSIEYNCNSISAGTCFIYSGTDGSNGTFSDNVPIGGDGGDGGIPSSETYGGPGGNGGLGPPDTSGSRPGQSYNGASSAGIGNQAPAYTPIKMADGTSAYVGYAGKQNEGGNCAQLLLYYQT